MVYRQDGPDQEDDPGLQLVGAAFNGDVVKIRRLIAANLTQKQKDAVDGNDHCALYYAARSGSIDVVVLLLECGCRAEDADWLPAVVEAHIKDNLRSTVDIVRRLAQAGVLLDAVDGQGQTAAHIAARGRRTDVVDELRSAGADMNCRCHHGRSVLDLLHR